MELGTGRCRSVIIRVRAYEHCRVRESRISQLGAEFQALLHVHRILDFLLVRRTSLGDQTRDRPIQRVLVAVQNDCLNEQLVYEPPKPGMQPKWVDSQGSRERSPDPGRSLGKPILILIMEPKPSSKFSFDPAGMVGELARHEFWHNQMDGIRPCGHQLQEFGGYPDLFCGHSRLLAGGVAAEQIEEVAGVEDGDRSGCAMI